jgi:hypothetical protein
MSQSSIIQFGPELRQIQMVSDKIFYFKLTVKRFRKCRENVSDLYSVILFHSDANVVVYRYFCVYRTHAAEEVSSCWKAQERML